jgi:signal transduction histidine kinase
VLVTDRALAEADASLRPLRRYLEHAPTASAVVSGAGHVLVFANAAFRRLSERAETAADVGVPIADTLPTGVHEGLSALLDRVRRDGIAAHDARLGGSTGRDGRIPRSTWCCDVWPVVEEAGRLDYLVVSIRAARRGEPTRARQRALTERLLLTALREQEQARRADDARERAVFLAESSRRLSASFEQEAAYAAVAAVVLPGLGAWSIVDVAQPNGAWRRLAIVHPDPTRRGLIRELDGHWSPAPGDPLGAPLVAQSREATIVEGNTDAVLATAAHGPDNLRILRALDLGPLLVVPLIAHERLRGAITFVGPSGAAPYTPDDVLLAQDLAVRCAGLLDGARLYDDARLAQIDADTARMAADVGRRDAEYADQVKTAFLTSMSHELRTPLNAILGYTELLQMGLRGPVSADQETALGRIKQAGTHLLGLINDVLNVAKLKSLQVRFLTVDVPVGEILDTTRALVEPQASGKELVFEHVPCASPLVLRGDREKVLQILLNLLSNAIKFTRPGGRITLAAAPTSPPVRLIVRDTGRGIGAEQLHTIFEPFVQVGRRLTGADEGTGLGLAISRDLARGMGGDLTVESMLGVGSTFTLSLPSAV